MPAEIPFPKKQSVTTVTLQIETNLLNVVKKHCKKNGLSFREAVEYGLGRFVEKLNEELEK